VLGDLNASRFTFIAITWVQPEQQVRGVPSVSQQDSFLRHYMFVGAHFFFFKSIPGQVRAQTMFDSINWIIESKSQAFQGNFVYFCYIHGQYFYFQTDKVALFC